MPLRAFLIRAFATAAICLVAAPLLALGFRAYEQNETAHISAIRTPRGVQEAMFVRLGGVDQWVEIRGEDRANPVLLFVHGGPGNAVSPLVSLFQPWEKRFTVVVWDQRCAGKTFARSGVKSCDGMSLERVARDGIELSEYLERRLQKPKIALFGFSSGTMVGLKMVHDRPELYSAYVGTGQVVSIPEKEPVVYDRAMARLTAAHDEAGVRKLLALGRPPYRSADDLMTERGLSLRHDSPAERDLTFRLASRVLVAPGWSLLDIYRYLEASSHAEAATFADTADYDARTLGLTFQVPIFVFNGADDNITPAALAERYVQTLTAPKAEFVTLPGAGHSAVLTEPDVILRELDRRVRPIVADAQPLD